METKACYKTLCRKDSRGQPLVDGRSYLIRRVGQKTSVVGRVEFDLDSDELFLVTSSTGGSQARQCVRELFGGVFTPIEDETAEILSAWDRAQRLAHVAEDCREKLDDVERELCELAGCGVGDGSETADAIFALVRDGRNTDATIGLVADLASQLESSTGRSLA